MLMQKLWPINCILAKTDSLIYHIEREEEIENDEAVDDEDELYEYHGT